MQPESKKKIYNFLTELRKDKIVTQKDLSIKLKVSVGFINALIKKMLRKGIIKSQQVPYKRFIYYLTPKGFSEKSKVVSDYFSASLSLFRDLRNEFNEIFKDNKNTKYILVGISEITEICILSALQNQIKILYVIDKVYKERIFMGIKVFKSIKKLKNNEKIIIADYSPKNFDVYKKCIKKFGVENITSIPSLHLIEKKNDK